MISIIIPSREEPYLKKTVEDILLKSKTEIEIIIVLDGYWIPFEQVINNSKVKYLHFGESKGMRHCINSAVAISRGEQIMKLDAHCMLDDRFDMVLLTHNKANQVQIPTRKRLEPESWSIIEDGRRDVNYLKLDENFKGVIDSTKNNNKSLDSIKIDEIESFQGSCWFMDKVLYNKLGLLDENYGGSGHEAQEITFKVWENGGKIVRNKLTWYAHWHKTKPIFKIDRTQSRTYFKKQIEDRKWKNLMNL